MEGAETITSPTRELAAIMFSDVVGYTALMGRDERKGLQAITDHREQLRALLPRFNGRLIGEIGDGTLSSFHSVLDAISCARELQANLKDDPDLRLRIGVHIGDVILTNNTVLGDGVNVASRIHALAPPGGICISEHVYDEIRNKPGMRAKDLGKKQLKNVSRPIRVYALPVSATPEAASLARRIPARRVAISAALSAIAIAIIVAFAYRDQIATAVRSRSPAAEATIATVAVLPFANLSDNKQDEYFSDGMTDEVIVQLSKISGMQVAARTSSFVFKGRNEDASKIARLLHVRNLLEGSVQRSADKVRIEVQLIDAVNGFTLWSDRYDKQVADVFQIQSEVAERVAQRLRVKLLPAVRARLDQRPTENLEAYDLYLQGRYYFSQLSEDGWTKAIDAFTRATEKDPNFALAYAGLAVSYGDASSFTMAPRDAIPRIRAATERALAIDDSLGEAHGALAYLVLYSYDWNWAGAEREFKRALEIEPSNALINGYYAEFLDHIGRYDEALQQAQRAYELNPLDLYPLIQIGAVYENSRNYQRALEYFNRAIERAPDFGFAYINRGIVLLLQGHHQEALHDFEKAAVLGISPLMQTWLGSAYAQTGRRSDALKVLSQLKELSGHRYVDPVAFVGIYWALGDKDQAFQYMNKAYEERSYFMTNLKWPIWDPLRSDTRFQAIYKKVGLPP